MALKLPRYFSRMILKYNFNMKTILFAVKIAITAIVLSLMALRSNAQYRLQIFHASDLEGGVEAITKAPHFAAIIDTLEEQYANTLILSAGDNYISGPFYSSADARSVRDSIQKVYNTLYGGIPNINLREGAGRIDISIMNAIGFNASALGNHEFDLGTAAIENIIAPEVRGGTDVRWLGANFPYLSANLDFSQDGNLSGLYESTIKESSTYKFDFSNPTAKTKGIAPSTMVTINGEKIGIVGATTPMLERISSPGNTKVKNPGAGTNDMNALAGLIQPQIDALVSAGSNKIILVSHLQQYQLEEALAGLLSKVDVIVSGGSDGIFANPGQRLRSGDVATKPYPVLLKNKDNDDVAVVSVDGQYSYVGHLVVEFDANGKLITSSINPKESRPYPTDSLMVDSLFGLNYAKAFAGNRKGAMVKTLTDAVSSIVIAKDGNIVGKTDVFLDGRRKIVRTQESNMGNLTADANLAAAKAYDNQVVFSLKNGGGIRAAIGSIIEEDPGVYSYAPPAANPLSGKKEGEVSQLDLENTMKFNNRLTIVEVNPAGLKALVEHGFAAWAPGATPGQMLQIGGGKISFDPSKSAGSRVWNFVIVDENGNVTDTIVREGAIYGNPNRTMRMVTLNFLAGGGDGYPFASSSTHIVQMDTITGLAAGAFTFAVAGSEQDALAEYMNAKYSSTPFDEEETPMKEDERIQILSERADDIFPVEVSFADEVIEESEKSASISIDLDYQNKTTQAATINVVVNSLSTATEGTDFTVSQKSFTAQAGQSGTFNFSISVTDDSNIEEDEYVILEVDPTENHLLDGGFVIVYLNDDDRKAPTASKAIELKFLSSFKGLDTNGNSTEIIAFDKTSKRLFIANSENAKVEVLDFADPENVSIQNSIDVSAYGDINSVTVHDGLVACAMESGTVDVAGKVVFFDTDGNYINDVTAGVLPDMVAFSHNGKLAVTANEGEPNDDYDIDPEGSITIIDLSSGAAAATATQLDFTAYNSQVDQLRNDGVRIFGNNGQSSVAQDLEPEYVTISADNKTAWVACQENNAIVEVDLVSKSIKSIKALGTKDHSIVGNGLDGNRDHDKVHISNYPVKGFYHPDAITSYSVGTTTYLVTANEGDARDYDGYSEEIRLRKKDIDLDPTAFPNEELVFSLIGDIKTTTANGDTDGDGDLDEIYTYGARSFSIWNGTTGALVYDSGNEMELISSQSELYGPLFNASNGPSANFRNRSDDKGPEPEAVVVGELSGKTYAFVGAERSGGVYVWDVTDPNSVSFVDHHNNRDTATGEGDLGPEGMVFIPNTDSPNKLDMLVVANEVSSTISIYHVFDSQLDTTTKDTSTVSVFNSNALVNAISVYPNPSNGIVNIDAGTLELEELEVISAQGQVIRKSNLNYSNTASINLQEEKTGVYILKVVTDQGTLTKPIILE